jgi:hypothetical protein
MAAHRVASRSRCPGFGVPRGALPSPSPGSENPDGGAHGCLRCRCLAERLAPVTSGLGVLSGWSPAVVPGMKLKERCVEWSFALAQTRYSTCNLAVAVAQERDPGGLLRWVSAMAVIRRVPRSRKLRARCLAWSPPVADAPRMKLKGRWWRCVRRWRRIA